MILSKLRASGAVVVALGVVAVCAACTGSSGGAAHTAAQSGNPTQPVNVSGSAGSTQSSGAASTSTTPNPSDTQLQTAPPPYPTPSGHDPVVSKDQAALLNSLPGRATAACATVGKHTDLRAGGVAVGNFVTARGTFAKQYGKSEVTEVSLYVIPQHAAHMSKVGVRVQPAGSGSAHTIVSKSVENANGAQYYAVNLPIPKPGSYRLVMTAGADRGCYEVTFRK